MSKRELAKIANEIKTIKSELNKVSAGGTSWDDHAKEWFVDLGKLIEKYSAGKITYKNVTRVGMTIYPRDGFKEDGTLTLSRDLLRFEMNAHSETFFTDYKPEGIAKTIATIASIYSNET